MMIMVMMMIMMMMTTFWDVVHCSPVKTDHCMRNVYCMPLNDKLGRMQL